MEKYQEKNLDNGTILIFGEIKDEMMKPIIEQLIYLNNKQISEVSLIINSFGGSVSPAFALIETMALMRNVKIKTVGLGAICSAGLMISMAGDERLISSNAHILAHQYSWGSEGKHHELVGHRKEQDLAHERIVNHFRKYTKLSKKVIETDLLRETDTWLSPKEALKYNLADSIINSF